MKKRLEVFGIAAEALGLSLLLCATFWENEFSGWWDTQSPEWQYWIQEEVNLSTLYILSDIANLSTIEDKERRSEAAWAVNRKASEAAIRAIKMRDERKEALKGQAAFFSQIKLWLLISSAAFLIAGKSLILLALLNNKKSTAESLTP